MAAAKDLENRKKAIAYMQEFKRKRQHIYNNKKKLSQTSTIVGALKQGSPELMERRQSIIVSIKDFHNSPHSPYWKKMQTISESPEKR